MFGRKFNRWSLATSLVGLALAVPILYVALQVFGDSSEAWTFVVVHWVYDYALNSCALLIGVCLLAMAMGIPAAWVVTMYSFPARGFFAWGLVLPLALPSYVTAYTYVGIFDYRGPVRTLFNVLGVDSLAFGPDLDIVNIYGLIAVMSFALYPYVYLTARASFAQHSNAVIEVAQSLGRTRSGAFWRIAMPLSRPALVGGVSLVGLETLNEYGAVKYYGLDTFTTGIFSAWYSLGDSDAATRLAACALIGTLVSGQLVDRFGGRQVAAHMMLPITLACAALWLIEGQAGVFLFFVFFGLAAGMPGTAVTAAMAELYGTRYLGEVKAIIMPLGVFSSALSPMTMGLLIDLGYGMGVLMLLNIALALLAQVGGTVMMTRPARVSA